MKKINTILISMLALCGCTREVYLQEVPCADCQPQVVEEPCPELEPQTVVYQVYEAPVVACPCVCAYYMTCMTPCCPTCCQQTTTQQTTTTQTTYTYTY